MENLTIYFLLLLAVIAGWALGRFSWPRGRRRPRTTGDIFEDYFVGLNYLLNDEPDEAIDTFIKALEINSETIETHLALGALLRRRGKLDKAITVHQTLLARPGLDRGFADSTKLQLAIDYISAGLLDRAERLLNEILDDASPARWEALEHLRTIYQTEKDWEKAIECSSRLLASNPWKRDGDLRSAAAHYCCELAEGQLRERRYGEAREQTRRALGFDKRNVRALLLLAAIEQHQGNYRAAIKQLVSVRRDNPEFTSLVLKPLAECYEQIENVPEYEKLLANTLQEEPDTVVVLALAELVRRRAGAEAAIDFLHGYLARAPSLTGLAELLRLQIPKADPDVGDNLTLLQKAIDKLLQERLGFQCNHCGYESRGLYWLCPSCQKWDKIKRKGDAGAVF